MPEDTIQEGCISYIQTMPLTARPELFGLHENAEITKEMKETQEVVCNFIIHCKPTLNIVLSYSS